ncbi:hypothetical protein ACFYW9_37910 [Streptomyces sp. NPDC002698]
MVQLLSVDIWWTVVAIVAGGLVIGFTYGFVRSAIGTIQTSLTHQ